MTNTNKIRANGHDAVNKANSAHTVRRTAPFAYICL